MKLTSSLMAFLGTAAALKSQTRQEKIPLPAPRSAYPPINSQPQGPVKPLPIIRPGLNATIDLSKIATGKPVKSQPSGNRLATCSGPIKSNPSTFWMSQMPHAANTSPRGYAPFLANYYDYPTWRNVLDYGARNDGSGDQTAAIQRALDDDGQNGSREHRGVTSRPAHVFLPGGTYTLGSKLKLRIGTIITGDPQNPPILRASSSFQGDTMIQGSDGEPTTSFLVSLRNVVLETYNVNKDWYFLALEWSVAQGCSLDNVKINMPENSSGHTGIALDRGSTITVADVQITGGAIGIRNSGQQVSLKNIYFKYCRTAYAGQGGWSVLFQKVTFETCGLGIDITNPGNPGNLQGGIVLLDSTSINSGTTIKFRESSPTAPKRNNQIVIQNFKKDNQNPIAVTVDNVVKLGASSVVDTWTWGNAVPGQFQNGVSTTTTRVPALLADDGTFFTMNAPTYAGYGLDQFINVKNVPGLPVNGDGVTDDGPSLNAILAQAAAACKIAYFPFGSYVVKNTLFVPPNSRIVGEAWPVINGLGSVFKNVNNPVPVVKVGSPGDVGIAHISDMRISPAEPLPGAIMMEVNIKGVNKGDVGIWNTQITFGGTADTSISNTCENQDTTNCRSAYLGLYLTPPSSAYVQNVWVWTADHNLDGGTRLTMISTGRGILVKSTVATWLVGTGSEHHWLYNYNFDYAQNIFAGMMQVETPYNQGSGAVLLAPAPWVANLAIGDPDFHWCNGGDGKCRSAVANNINGGSNLYLYSSVAWGFFDGPWDGEYGGDHWCQGNCQTNMNRVSGQPSGLYWFGIGTKSADVLVLDGRSNPKELNNPGGWGGIVQNYREFV